MNKVIQYISEVYNISSSDLSIKEVRDYKTDLTFTNVYLKGEFVFEVFTLPTKNLGINTMAKIRDSFENSPVYKLHLLGL